MLISSLSSQTPGPQELLPQALAARLDALDIASRRLVTGRLMGERRGKRRGRSVEFDDHRPYSPGDDLRHIDWAAFARLDKLFLKLFLEEEDLLVHIVLDCSTSMLAGSPTKLLTAGQLACALAYVGLVNNNTVQLSAFALDENRPATGGLMRLDSLRGRTGTQRAVSFVMECLQRASESPLDRTDTLQNPTLALRSIASSLTGRGVLIVITDALFADATGKTIDFQTPLRFLPAGSTGWGTYLLQVLAPGEIDPTKEHAGASRNPLLGDLLLTDIESRRSIEISAASDALLKVRAASANFVQSLHEYARRRGIIHALMPSDADITRFTLDTLRRDGLLG
jgi:hypothetical protein